MFVYRFFCYVLFFVPLNVIANTQRTPLYIGKLNDFTDQHKYILMKYYLLILITDVISKRNQRLFKRIYTHTLLLNFKWLTL